MPSDPTISQDARCQVPPEGWWCSREPGHDGPCAARIDPETDKAGGLWYSRWWGAMERVEALERELAHLRTPATDTEAMRLLMEANNLLFDSLYHLRLDDGAKKYHEKAVALRARIDALAKGGA